MQQSSPRRAAAQLAAFALLMVAAGCARHTDDGGGGGVVNYANGWIHWAEPGERVIDIATRYKRNAELMGELNDLEITAQPGAGRAVYVQPVDDRDAVNELVMRIRSNPEIVAVNPPPAGAIESGMMSTKAVLNQPQRELPRDLLMKMRVWPHGDGFHWPVKGEILRQFGGPSDGLLPGLCIAAAEGEPVAASRGGEVIYAGEMRGYGQVVIVRHGEGFVSVYGYLENIRVKEGARLKEGQPLAEAGRPSLSSPPQLFFQIRKDDRPIDPLRILH